jgi:hypothetical protein
MDITFCTLAAPQAGQVISLKLSRTSSSKRLPHSVHSNSKRGIADFLLSLPVFVNDCTPAGAVSAQHIITARAQATPERLAVCKKKMMGIRKKWRKRIGACCRACVGGLLSLRHH